MPVHRRAVSFASILSLFFLSGATSLVYQVIWLRQLVLAFGSTLHATSAVLAVFMGGLALGAFVGGRWIARHRARPLLVYGLLEIAVGVYALFVPNLLDLGSAAYEWAWRTGVGAPPAYLGSVKFLALALVLLPPTTFMGATLPVLSKRTADDPSRVGGQVGTLYAINTLGAVLGTALAGFVLLPTFGVRATTILCAVSNVVLGLTAMLLGRGDRSRDPGPVSRPAERQRWRARGATALSIIAVSGFAAMTLEVAWTRGLALVFGSSVYAFALMLVAFLIGLGTGSAAVSALLRKRGTRSPGALLALCLVVAGFGSFATTYVLQSLPGLFARIFFATSLPPAPLFATQLLLGLLLMFPTTFALGGVFPAVLQAYARGLDDVAGAVGRAYAANTAGTIAGSLAAGFVLVPKLGLVDTLTLAAAVQVGLAGAAVLALIDIEPRRRWVPASALLGCVLAFFAVRPEWDFLKMNSGVFFNLQDAKPGTDWSSYLGTLRRNTRVVLGREGLIASVLVADDIPSGGRFLAVNGKIEASSNTDLETQLMIAHLPLLIHDDPRDVLVVGLASGISVGAAAAHRVESIRVLEVEGLMIEAARLFSESNGAVLDDPRVAVSINDARNELMYDPRTYDVIISEPSNPWMTVASNLFTREFFLEAKRRIRPGGIFCQWVQLYCLRPDDLQAVIAAFHSAFPNVLVFGTQTDVDLVLLGTDDPIRFDLEKLDRRMRDLPVAMSLGRVGARSPLDLVTLFRVGDREVPALVDRGTVNTDDNGKVEFSAPKALFLPTWDANTAFLLGARSDPLPYLVPPPSSPEEAARIRIEIGRRRIARGAVPWARAILTPALDGPLAEAAQSALRQLDAE